MGYTQKCLMHHDFHLEMLNIHCVRAAHSRPEQNAAAKCGTAARVQRPDLLPKVSRRGHRHERDGAHHHRAHHVKLERRVPTHPPKSAHWPRYPLILFPSRHPVEFPPLPAQILSRVPLPKIVPRLCDVWVKIFCDSISIHLFFSTNKSK